MTQRYMPCTRAEFITEGPKTDRLFHPAMTADRQIEVWRQSAQHLRQTARTKAGEEQRQWLFAAMRCSAVAIHLTSKGAA